MKTTTPITAGDSVESFARDDDSVSEQQRQVRAAALALLGKAETGLSATDMGAAVEKAAAALKVATDIGRAHADLAKVNQEIASLKRTNELAPKRERSERLRDYVALLTPLVAIITLAATLIAQSWQFVRSERSKQEDALNAQWQDAVKTISASGALSPALVELQPFLRSPKYAAQARDVAINLLANSSDVAFFNSLFGTAFAPISWNGIDGVVRLDRALHARVNPLASKTWDAQRRDNDKTRLTTDELASFNYVQEVLPTIASQIGGVLKTPRPVGIQVDLSATLLSTADWQSIDLDAANLQGALLAWMGLRDVKLANVTKFTGLTLVGTAWWEAKSINRPLLEYLKANSPFSPGTYGPHREESNQAAYDAAIVRLTSQLK